MVRSKDSNNSVVVKIFYEAGGSGGLYPVAVQLVPAERFIMI